MRTPQPISPRRSGRYEIELQDAQPWHPHAGRRAVDQQHEARVLLAARDLGQRAEDARFSRLERAQAVGLAGGRPGGSVRFVRCRLIRLDLIEQIPGSRLDVVLRGTRDQRLQHAPRVVIVPLAPEQHGVVQREVLAPRRHVQRRANQLQPLVHAVGVLASVPCEHPVGLDERRVQGDGAAQRGLDLRGVLRRLVRRRLCAARVGEHHCVVVVREVQSRPATRRLARSGGAPRRTCRRGPAACPWTRAPRRCRDRRPAPSRAPRAPRPAGSCGRADRPASRGPPPAESASALPGRAGQRAARTCICDLVERTLPDVGEQLLLEAPLP